MEQMKVTVEVPTALRSMGRRSQSLLQRIVDTVGEEKLPRVIEYVESDPARFEGMLRDLLKLL